MSLAEEIERAHAEFEATQRAIGEIQHDMVGRRVTATSANRAVSVSCDLQGDVVDITFHTRGFRTMAGPELAALLVTTIGEAKRLALAEVATMFSSVLPDATPVFEMLNGTADFDEMMRAAIRHLNEAPEPGGPDRR
jgi:DNA-binding protein YbaB